MFNEKDSAKPGLTRRTILKGSAGVAALATLGAPAIVRAQSDVIRIGHLTPRTGFLGPLGEYGVMGVTLATEEINAAGGVLGRSGGCGRCCEQWRRQKCPFSLGKQIADHRRFARP